MKTRLPERATFPIDPPQKRIILKPTTQSDDPGHFQLLLEDVTPCHSPPVEELCDEVSSVLSRDSLKQQCVLRYKPKEFKEKGYDIQS